LAHDKFTGHPRPVSHGVPALGTAARRIHGNRPLLYVREARRLVGDYVLTEADCRLQRTVTDSVGMGSYHMDSHNCTRFVTVEAGRARVRNEGDVQIPPHRPLPGLVPQHHPQTR
jgi:hypothetical protein